ncbi:protein of unknown function [Paenibacillus alvei]|uniref:Uncharacterized protein n=1 Tax=Paenibacillus alvei TaxID=44250 RepID=A0A383RDS5_PAEAL|nr:protein of unknown function [Paenibacillus alvei]
MNHADGIAEMLAMRRMKGIRWFVKSLHIRIESFRLVIGRNLYLILKKG